MSRERRKSSRKAVKYTVWIEGGDGSVEHATLADVSVTGARVEMAANSDIADQVLLRLSRSADVVRPCKVVWSEGGQLGLRFETPAVNPRRKAWVG